MCTKGGCLNPITRLSSQSHGPCPVRGRLVYRRSRLIPAAPLRLDRQDSQKNTQSTLGQNNNDLTALAAVSWSLQI